MKELHKTIQDLKTRNRTNKEITNRDNTGDRKLRKTLGEDMQASPTEYMTQKKESLAHKIP